MLHIHLKRYFAIALSLFMFSGISLYCFTQQAQAQALKERPRLSKRDLLIPAINTIVHIQPAVNQ